MTATLHFVGSRVDGPRTGWEPPATPDFYFDPRRACNPDHGISELWTSSDKADLSKAAKICNRRCPFTDECRAWAVKNGERHHAWGGFVFSKIAERKKAAQQEDVAA